MARDYPEEFSPEIKAATTAATRFGYGLRPGELARIATDGATHWLIEQAKPQRLPKELQGLMTSEQALAELITAKKSGKEAFRKFKKKIASQARNEAEIHALVTLNSPDPFRERLVRFWTNHFTISIRSPRMAGLVAAFEREAIRPYIDGQFSQMLLAVAKHPAMLIYLDNAKSMGKHSPAGRRKGKGYNENYARELLELHTVGPGIHYTQKDIIELANILTGWTLARPKSKGAGSFTFNPKWHEPGSKTVMKKTFPEAGILEGEAVLNHLSTHPATAHHLATKMARHFISDSPSNKLIKDMVWEFNKSDGHVMSLATGMVDSKASWHQVPQKIKTPEDLVFSTMRGLNMRPKNGRIIIRALELLGQRPFAAPSPAGWPDMASSWINPDSLLERLEWSASLAKRNRVDMAPTDHALDILGAQLSQRTYNHMAIAENPHEAISLMLTSPEFQRR